MAISIENKVLTNIEDKVLTNMSQEKINQIMNAAAEEIAKYVDVCNEGGQLVMKVKDGVKLKKVDIFLGNNYYILSDKEFCNPVGMSEKKAFIDIDQESKVVTRCTIPTSVKFSKKNKDRVVLLAYNLANRTLL